MDRVDFALEVFVLSMSLSLGGVLLLVVSHEAIAESGGDSPFPVHPLAVLGALVALYLGVIAVPRWGDRLSKPCDPDD